MILGIDASNIRTGGGLTHLTEFIRNANPTKYGFKEVIVWASQSTLSKLPDKDWLHKQNHYLLNKSILFRIIWQKLYLSSEVRKLCDILFLPSGNTSNFHPYISMCQNLLPFESVEKARFGWSFSRVRLELLKWNQCRSFRNADGVIFLSNYSINVIKGVCGRINNSVIIQHGISDIFRTTTLKRSNTNKVKLLYVSIINQYKHQWNVIRAVHKLLDLKYNITLTLVGAQYPPALSKVQAAVNERPEYKSNIILKEKIPYEQLSDVYKEHDLFVFASSCETFGMIVLEAMASGLPLVCSNRSSMKEIIGDSAIYFDPLNINEIVTAIKEYLQIPSLVESMSQKSLEYSSNYSWKKSADETLDYLSNIYNQYSVAPEKGLNKVEG